MPVTINGSGAISGLVITTADLADSSVTTSKIADGAVATADLANGAVTNAKMATGAAVANIGFTPADATATVNLTGNQSIGGTKTFTSGITFNDGTTQTTAASGVPGSWGAVGTVTMALIPASSITQTIAEGSTVSGSVLQRMTDSAAGNENLDAFNTMFTDFNVANAYFRWLYGAQTNLGLTGTWRVLTRARITRTGGSASSLFLPALLQRIS